MNKKWLVNLNRNTFYKVRQLQAIAYASIALNTVLLLVLILIMVVY